MTVLNQKATQVVMRLSEKGNGSPVMSYRLIRFSLPAENDAEIVMRYPQSQFFCNVALYKAKRLRYSCGLSPGSQIDTRRIPQRAPLKSNRRNVRGRSMMLILLNSVWVRHEVSPRFTKASEKSCDSCSCQRERTLCWPDTENDRLQMSNERNTR